MNQGTMDKKYAVGVDVGGQTSKIGIVDQEGNVLSQSVIRSDIYGSDAEAFISALADAIKGVVANAGKSLAEIVGVGVGAPNGNYYDGTISNAPNLAWAAQGSVEFSKILSERLGLKVTLTNDANAAAVGEMTYGAAKGMKDFIMITLGTGVGSGIVIDGKVLYGHDGFAGELGHVCVVRENGRQCGCGKKGCLETYCSATGVARTAKEWLESSDEPSLLRDIANVSSKDVFEAAEKGDAMALKIFDYTGELLGRTFADFIAFSAPEAIVLFGGLARSRKYLETPIRNAMEENVMKNWKGKVKLVFSALKESDAAILGASALAWA
ncbi:MAG: ROK family protein [Bacteroidales bacterium]|nr:ROK family protein [Bacteroidales bacterium]